MLILQNRFRTGGQERQTVLNVRTMDRARHEPLVAVLLLRLWSAGRDPVVGAQGRAVFAGLAGYLLCEMANGYSLSWFLFFLFAASAAVVHLAALRRGAAERTA